MGARVRLRTLGDCTIHVGETRVGPDSVVFFGLLLYLAVQRGKPVPRGRLRELFWPDVPESKAWHSLRQLLYRMRQLGIDVEATGSHIALDAGAVEADFAAFDALNGAAAKPVMAPGQAGVFLAGYSPLFSEPFATWVDDQRSIVHAKLRRALLDGIADTRARGEWVAVECLAREVLTIDPLNEEATLSLAEAAALSGNKAEAVALLDRYAAELGDAHSRRLDLPPSLLRRRIAERLPDPTPTRPLEGAFVGREEGIAFLYRAMQLTKAGRSENCCIDGPAGIGKTRLVEEFSRIAALQGVRVERVGCQHSDGQRPMSVLAELVPRLLALPGGLGCSPESLKYLERLRAHGVGSSNPDHLPSDAEALSANIRRSIHDVLGAVAAECSIMIVIEDVHWADDRSRETLAEMAHRSKGSRLAFVFTTRTADALSIRDARLHSVRPLMPAEARALIESLARQSQWPGGEAIDRCVRVAEGNPFYVRELVSHWQSTGDTEGVPPSLSALLDKRLSGLTSAATVTLQAMAVLGRNSNMHRLSTILQLPSHELLSAVNELALHGLASGVVTTMGCTHELITRAALARLTPVGLSTLHGLTALGLERERPTSPSAHILWDCAMHWKLAGDPSRAIQFSIDCSKHLFDLGLPNEAATLLLAARPLCADAGIASTLLSALAEALQRAGRWGELYDVLRDKRNNLEPLLPPMTPHDEEELLFLAAAWRANRVDHSHLLEWATKCARSQETPLPHRIAAASQGLIIASECCEQESASGLYQDIVEMAQGSTVDDAVRLEIDTVYHSTFGDLKRGAIAARELVSVTRSLGNPAALARSLRFAAFPCRLMGCEAEAESFLLESLAITREHHLRSAEISTMYKLGANALAGSQPHVSLQWYERVCQVGLDDEEPIVRASLAILGTQAYLALGNKSVAEDIFRPIADLRISDSLTRPAQELLATLVRIQIERGRASISAEAVSRLRTFHLRTRAMGDQDFAAATLFRALAATGYTEEARELLELYIERYRRDRSKLESELMRVVDQSPTLRKSWESRAS